MMKRDEAIPRSLIPDNDISSKSLEEPARHGVSMLQSVTSVTLAERNGYLFVAPLETGVKEEKKEHC